MSLIQSKSVPSEANVSKLTSLFGIKALFKGSASYGFANAGVAGAQFMSILIFAAALPPDAFGHVSIFSVLCVVLCMLTGMGLSASAQQAYFSLSKADFQLLVSAIVFAVLIVAIVLFLLIWVLPSALVVHLNLPRAWLLVAMCVAIAQVLVQLVLTVLQTLEQIQVYSGIVTLQVVIVIVSAGVFYISESTHWEAAVLAQVSAPMFTSLCALIVLWRMGCLRIPTNFRLLREALKYSLPLVPHQVAGWSMAMVDRFIIVNSLGVTHAGVYSLSFQIAQSTNIISNSFNQALVPILFRKLAEKKNALRQVLFLNFLYGISLVFFSISFIAMFLIFAPYLLSQDYVAVLSYGPWLIISFLFLALSRIASNFLLFYGRTGVLAISTMCAAALSFLINLWLVPVHGVIGACWTSIMTFFFLLIVTSWQARSCHQYLR